MIWSAILVSTLLFLLAALILFAAQSSKCPKCGSLLRIWTDADTASLPGGPWKATGLVCPNDCYCRIRLESHEVHS